MIKNQYSVENKNLFIEPTNVLKNYFLKNDLNNNVIEEFKKELIEFKIINNEELKMNEYKHIVEIAIVVKVLNYIGEIQLKQNEIEKVDKYIYLYNNNISRYLWNIQGTFIGMPNSQISDCVKGLTDDKNGEKYYILRLIDLLYEREWRFEGLTNEIFNKKYSRKLFNYFTDYDLKKSNNVIVNIKNFESLLRLIAMVNCKPSYGIVIDENKIDKLIELSYNFSKIISIDTNNELKEIFNIIDVYIKHYNKCVKTKIDEKFIEIIELANINANNKYNKLLKDIYVKGLTEGKFDIPYIYHPKKRKNESEVKTIKKQKVK